MGKLVLLTESLAYWHFKVKQIKLQAPETLIMKGMPDPVLLPPVFFIMTFLSLALTTIDLSLPACLHILMACISVFSNLCVQIANQFKCAPTNLETDSSRFICYKPLDLKSVCWGGGGGGCDGGLLQARFKLVLPMWTNH